MTTTPRRRLLVAASALLAGGLGVSALSPSGASVPSSAPSGDTGSVTLRAPQPARGKAWIQGVVVDRAGRSPLGVQVEAFAPGSSTPVATDLTYAGLNIHGDEVEGFYRLVVPVGEYVLKYSTPGARDPFRTVRNDKAVVEVGRREILDLDAQTLTLQRKATVAVDAALSTKRVRSTKRAEVELEVTSPDVAPVTGDVTVTSGRKVYGEATLVRSDRGRTEIELPKLRPGVYRLVVAYAGNDHTAPGSSSRLTLTVVRR